MAKIRIYELARDLNMTNKVLLEKMRNMDIQVKSHMSSLDDDTVAKIRKKYSWFTGKGNRGNTYKADNYPKTQKTCPESACSCRNGCRTGISVPKKKKLRINRLKKNPQEGEKTRCH